MPEKNTAGLSIIELPELVLQMFERVQPEAMPAQQLFIRYLRRKAERGLAIIFSTEAASVSQTLSLTLDEQALDGPNIRFTRQQVEQAQIEVLASGVLRSKELGLTIQAFPNDEGLPTLKDCFNTDQDGPIFASLQRAAQRQFHDLSYHLHHVEVQPVRYKPGSRCVIRYKLWVSPPHDDEPVTAHHDRQLNLFGKVYAKPQQASDVFAMTHLLYDEQAQRRVNSLRINSLEGALLPQPLALVPECGLTLTEAVQAPATALQTAILRTGTEVFRPGFMRDRGGAITNLGVPEASLGMTATALARIHTSHVKPADQTPRTGAKEAKRARERANLIASYYPKLSEQVLNCVEDLAQRLQAQTPETYLPAHGGFKASQLLFHSSKVFVVDFDGLCLADPALDVGYFLAYLRPSTLWYHKSGAREWFEEGARIFLDCYQQGMLARGNTPDVVQGILKRTHLYEAALIFKIATRRVNRLNSPRLPELTAMLDEIQGCLEA
ncbi:MAG TPA: phosphotransferase [Ktedonobacteraceae bacterium]|nr:phosphotransferase [Ktedonobacteraceae bacterium]